MEDKTPENITKTLEQIRIELDKNIKQIDASEDITFANPAWQHLVNAKDSIGMAILEIANRGDKNKTATKPHSKKMGKIILLPKAATNRANLALEALRDGHEVTTDCLETLDEIVQGLTPTEENCLEIESHKGPMSVEMVKRLRFERGFDIRPNAPAE